MDENIQAFLDRLELEFNDPELAIQALTHVSYVNEHPEAVCYERLEFLGDAVLELVIRDFFFTETDLSEGDAVAAKSILVNNKALGEFGRLIGIHKVMRFSNGGNRNGGRENPYIAACALEALIGAIYKDQGIGIARMYVDYLVLRHIRDKLEGELRDPKTRLMHEAQARWNAQPVYSVVDKQGQAHTPVYTVEVAIKNRIRVCGTGPSVKEASMNAAANVLAQYFDIEKRKGV